MKRVGSILMITFLLISIIIPYLRDPIVVSAYDSLPSGYTSISSDDDLASCFDSYVKSRNANYTGTLPEAVDLYILNKLRIGANHFDKNLEDVKQGIAKKSETGGKVIWYLDNTTTNFFNDLFDFLLQDMELEVGDTADQQVYSGRLYIDKNGVGYYLYEFNTSNGSYSVKGTDIYTASYLASCRSTNTIPDPTTVKVSDSEVWTIRFSYSNGNMVVHFDKNGVNQASRQCVSSSYACDICLLYGINTTTYYFGVHFNNNDTCQYSVRFVPASDEVTPNCVVNFVSNNIKNEYEGNTYITNEGDIINNNTDPDYNPYPDGGGTVTPPTNTGGGSGVDDTEVTFPNFDFQLPEIDWSIGDLSEKFPFSIPFDLVAFFTVMNAEPQAPQIDREIPLGSWYTWRFQADFSQFDDYAVIIRNVEFIAFCVGLIYLTIKLVRG